MTNESPEKREERKRRFIRHLRERKFTALFEPLGSKLERFFRGETEAEDVLKTVRYVARRGEELVTLFKKRTDVILAGISMEENRYVTEINDINVKLRHGDITLTFADALVNPASSDGSMERGLAGVLKKTAGDEVENEARSKAPITPEKPIVTGPGKLPLMCIIHVATMVDGKSDKSLIHRATGAALSLAEELGCEVVAIPAIGTGEGGVSPDEAASAVVDAIKEHKQAKIRDIILIDISEPTVEAFERVLERFDEEN